jgi:putative transposase
MAPTDIPSLCLTFKYRLLPTRRQHGVLQRILDQQRDLYKAALRECREAYHRAGITITYLDQQKSLTETRQTCEGWNIYPANLQRGLSAAWMKPSEVFSGE